MATHRQPGRYEKSTVAGEAVSAFVPDPLPPQLKLTAGLQEKVRLAEQKLSRLELAGEMVPSLEWFIYAFVRKEAVVSSQIEGTQASLVDLLAYEAGAPAGMGESSDDVEEVSNYLAALAYARQQLRSAKGLPLSTRLLNEAHRRLMKGDRGATKQPGELRRSQNWIGGTRPGNAVFVPPPPERVADLLSQLEHFIHGAETRLPPLGRGGLVDAQFETIHPFLDGNGRIGRLLIAALMEQWGLLPEPLMYLSGTLKRHQREYYRLLSAVRAEGDWEAWIVFFLHAVEAAATEAECA